MQKVRALCLVALAVSSALPFCRAQEPARLSNLAPFVGTVNHVPATNKFALTEIRNDQTNEAYWMCKGLTTFNDGTQATRFEYRAPFYSPKERKAQRRKTVKACLDWLDHSEGP